MGDGGFLTERVLYLGADPHLHAQSADLTREAFLLDAPSGFAAPQPKTRAKPGPPAKGTQIGEIADDGEEVAGQPRRKRAKVDTSLTEKARDKGPRQTNNRESSPEIEIVGTSTRDARSQKTELQLELALQTMCTCLFIAVRQRCADSVIHRHCVVSGTSVRRAVRPDGAGELARTRQPRRRDLNMEVRLTGHFTSVASTLTLRDDTVWKLAQLVRPG